MLIMLGQCVNYVRSVLIMLGQCVNYVRSVC